MHSDSGGREWEALIPQASEKLRFLVDEHGFRQQNEIARWGTSVTFAGEVWTLYLFYGEREFDFLAEITYHAFPRKTPRPLWALLAAMGIEVPEVASGSQTRVDAPRLCRLVAETAALIAGHGDALSRVPTRELFRDVKKLLDRYSRRLRSAEVGALTRKRSA